MTKGGKGYVGRRLRSSRCGRVVIGWQWDKLSRTSRRQARGGWRGCWPMGLAEGAVPSGRPENGPLVNTIESLIMFLGRSSGACSLSHIGCCSPVQASHPPFVFRFRFLSPVLFFLLAVSRGLALSLCAMMQTCSSIRVLAVCRVPCVKRSAIPHPFAAASQAPSVDRYRRSFKANPSSWSSHSPVFRSINPPRFDTLHHVFDFAPFWPVLRDSGPRTDSSQWRR